jgi:hypothetical protein
MQSALDDIVLGELVDAPFGWREGWEYVVPPPRVPPRPAV